MQEERVVWGDGMILNNQGVRGVIVGVWFCGSAWLLVVLQRGLVRG